MLATSGDPQREPCVGHVETRPVGRLWAGLDSGRTGGFQCGTVGLPLPVGDSTDFGKGYSQPEFSTIFVFNVSVRPTRISPRQSGAAGPRSTLRGCAARPGSSVAYCSPAAPTGPSP